MSALSNAVWYVCESGGFQQRCIQPGEVSMQGCSVRAISNAQQRESGHQTDPEHRVPKDLVLSDDR